MSPKVLLTSTTWWPSASRLAIALSKVGCDVAAVCPSRGHPLLKTAVVKKRFSYSALRPLGSLATAIRAYQPEIIIPCDDGAVQHLHELYELGPAALGTDLSTLIERSLGSPESYRVVVSRNSLLEIAVDMGLRVPDTLPINSVNDLEAWGARQPLPWVLKADGTCGGYGVTIANNLRSAKQFSLAMTKPLSTFRACKRLIVNRTAFSLRPWWKRSRSNVIAQKYIPGRPANCGFFCWQGKVLAIICVEVIHAQGATGTALVVRVVKNPEMAVAADRLASRLGLSGFFGLDFVIEEGSNAAYLIEMNPRCTPLCHLQLGEGQDMAGALWAQLSGEPCKETPPVTRDQTITYFPQAWHWDRKLSTRQSSFHDVPWEDPGLVRELMQLPWADRGILARVSNRLRHMTFADRATRGGGVFESMETTPHPIAPQNQAGRTLASGKRNHSIHLSSIVPLRQGGDRDPLFLIHGVDADILSFHRLVRHLEPSQPAYFILPQALLGDRIACTRIEEMARYYLEDVQALQPQGPYHFLGYSFGGLIAFEMARQLHSQGQDVGLVGLIDNRRMASAATLYSKKPGENGSEGRRLRVAYHMHRLLSSTGLSYAREKLRARCLRTIYTLLDAMHQPIPPFLQYAYDINWFAAVRYRPQFFPGRVTLFQTEESIGSSMNDQWTRLAGEGAEVRRILGSHETLFDEPQVKFLAREITDCLSKVCGPACHSNGRGG